MTIKFTTPETRSRSSSISSSNSSVGFLQVFASESFVPSRPPTTPQPEIVLTFPYLPQQDIKVKLAVDAGPGCGGIAWPAGEVMSRYICWRYQQDKGYLLDKSVIDLGSGTGLVGLVAGLLESQCDIYITDQTALLPLMQRNVDLNFPQTSDNLTTTTSSPSTCCPVKVIEYDWAASDIPSMLPQSPVLILAADCVYFEPAFPLLVATLCKLAPIGEERDILFCWKKRRKADMRFFKMLHRHFKSQAVEDDRPGEREKYEREGVRLMRLTRVK